MVHASIDSHRSCRSLCVVESLRVHRSYDLLTLVKFLCCKMKALFRVHAKSIFKPELHISCEAINEIRPNPVHHIMKKIILSDHVSDQANAAANKRHAEFENAFASYEGALAKREAQQMELAEISKRLWGERRYPAWILSFIPRIASAISSMPPVPVKAVADREEMVWQAGGNGEQRVLDVLSKQLGDEWVAISGYMNPSGEIDLLLVGPDGVMAVEVKYVNGKVHCDGDRWWLDKCDRYGNMVQRNIPIQDRKGRGPSLQVNTAASRLQRFLAERTPVTVVLRAVVLSHELSSIGDLRYITVDAISTLDTFYPMQVFDELVGTGHKLLVDDLVRLISEDHRYHASRSKK